MPMPLQTGEKVRVRVKTERDDRDNPWEDFDGTVLANLPEIDGVQRAHIVCEHPHPGGVAIYHFKHCMRIDPSQERHGFFVP